MSDDLIVRVNFYNPDERACEKAASRQRDEEYLERGVVSHEQLQLVNGGHGMFRNSVIVRRPSSVRAVLAKLEGKE